MPGAWGSMQRAPCWCCMGLNDGHGTMHGTQAWRSGTCCACMLWSCHAGSASMPCLYGHGMSVQPGFNHAVLACCGHGIACKGTPVKNCGNLTGRMTASFRASLAPSKPATSSHCTRSRQRMRKTDKNKGTMMEMRVFQRPVDGSCKVARLTSLWVCRGTDLDVRFFGQDGSS